MPSPSDFFARIRAQFTRVKLPAWLVLLLLAIREIPDWKSRIDFWIEVAHQMGGVMGGIAGAMASPLFTPILASLAVLYLIFVGEPKKGMQRHPWWPLIGWIVFAVCFATIAIPADYGALQIVLNAQVNSRISDFQKKAAPTFWRLTDGQKQLLAAGLSSVPEKDRFQIPIMVLIGSNQSQAYGNDLIGVFVHNNWKASGSMDASLRPDLLGLWVAISPEVKSEADASPKTKKLMEILTAAQIQFKIAAKDGAPKDYVGLAVGAGPEP